MSPSHTAVPGNCHMCLARMLLQEGGWVASVQIIDQEESNQSRNHGFPNLILRRSSCRIHGPASTYSASPTSTHHHNWLVCCSWVVTQADSGCDYLQAGLLEASWHLVNHFNEGSIAYHSTALERWLWGSVNSQVCCSLTPMTYHSLSFPNFPDPVESGWSYYQQHWG